MAIPDYQSLMLPLLKLTTDGKEHTLAEAVDALADALRLTTEERAALVPSGTLLFHGRVGWAKTYLKLAGLLEQPARGRFRITQRGHEVAQQGLERITVAWLRDHCPVFAAHFVGKKLVKSAVDAPAAYKCDSAAAETPQETVERGHEALRERLADELLDKVKSCTPAFFERLVVDLLVAMGYGGSRQDAGKVVGGSGDGGIDGIIKEDKLGLDALYIQAKRWEAAVGRPVVQSFAGSMEAQRARKGVLITTSRFSKDAHDYVAQIEKKIVLMDGEQLVEHMINCGLGVSTAATYTVHRLDLDYFEEEV